LPDFGEQLIAALAEAGIAIKPRSMQSDEPSDRRAQVIVGQKPMI
jgi:hypothetical protein